VRLACRAAPLPLLLSASAARLASSRSCSRAQPCCCRCCCWSAQQSNSSKRSSLHSSEQDTDKVYTNVDAAIVAMCGVLGAQCVHSISHGHHKPKIGRAHV